MDGSLAFAPVTAIEGLLDRYRQDLRHALAELADCRRKGLRVSARFRQQEAVRLYLYLRRLRHEMGELA